VTTLHLEASVDEWGYWRRLSRRRPIGNEGIERLLVMVVQLLARYVGGRVPPTAPAARVIAPWLFGAPEGVSVAESPEDQQLRLLRQANAEAEREAADAS